MNDKTRRLVIGGMITALILLLGLTPLGYPEIPPFAVTIVTVPVCIGAMLLGPWYGLFFGLLFGLTSMYRATVTGLPSAPIFLDPRVAIIPRLLVPIAAWAIFVLLNKLLKSDEKNIGKMSISGLVAGAVGAITNTIFVLLMIYLLHAQMAAELFQVDVSVVGAALAGLGLSSGLPEAIVCALLCGVVMLAVTQYNKKRGNLF